MSERRQLVSVVVPCYNEDAVLMETHRRLTGVLTRVPGVDYEIIYVDDGSRDATNEVLRCLRATDRRARVLRLSRNFGHQIAVSAGLEHASGDAVVVIDADLQDPPELLPEMIARWRNGVDVVYGVRTHRGGESTFKRWTASVFYRMINRVSEIDFPLDAGDFRLLDRVVVDALRAMPERDRYVRGMVSWTGYHQEALEYERAPRFAGRSKYPLFKMLRFAADGILSFSTVPLRLASCFGFVASGIAVAGIVYALGVRLLTKNWVTGWTAIFTAVLFIGGVQLICVGLLGEYIGRIYNEGKQRPLYFVRERIGFAAYAQPVRGERILDREVALPRLAGADGRVVERVADQAVVDRAPVHLVRDR
jgi:polyisoprenyl-phosphate glycosyltransferase